MIFLSITINILRCIYSRKKSCIYYYF